MAAHVNRLAHHRRLIPWKFGARTSVLNSSARARTFSQSCSCAGFQSQESFARNIIFKMAPVESHSKPYTIFVEGNIGSGKTTFLSHFEASGIASCLSEPVNLWRNVEGENLLARMYNDPSRWSITLQSYIQLTMLQQHVRPVNHPIKMMERSIYSARYCFVENLHKSEVMPKADFIVLDQWFQWILNNLNVSGDLLIYLRTSPEVVHKRIIARARTEESCIPLEYLQQIHNLHESWLIHRSSFPCPAAVMVIDANQDLESMKAEALTCVRKIKDAVMKPAKPVKLDMSPSKVASS